MSAKQTPNWLRPASLIAGGTVFVACVALLEVGDTALTPAAFLAITGALAACVAVIPCFRRGSTGVKAVAPGSEPQGKAPASNPRRSPRDGVPYDVAREPSARLTRPEWGGNENLHAAPDDDQDLAGNASKLDYEKTADTGTAVGRDLRDRSAGGLAGNESTIGVKPVRLSDAREGRADDLKRVGGVDAKLEVLLHPTGFSLRPDREGGAARKPRKGAPVEHVRRHERRAATMPCMSACG